MYFLIFIPNIPAKLVLLEPAASILRNSSKQNKPPQAAGILVTLYNSDMATDSKIPILVSIELDDFWRQMRVLIREELKSILSIKSTHASQDTTAFQIKPLYSMDSVRTLFDDVSRTTIYEWIKCGKLKPRKLKGKVYFLWTDIEKVLTQSD